MPQIYNTPEIQRLKFWKLAGEPIDPDACWLWQGRLNHDGYGNFYGDTTTTTHAHRWAWNSWRGPLTKGLVIDHLCRVRSCVNPRHLEPVTQTVNVRRGLAGAYSRAKTHCPRGHEYSDLNTRHYDGRRHCRICDRMRQAKYRASRPRKRRT